MGIGDPRTHTDGSSFVVDIGRRREIEMRSSFTVKTMAILSLFLSSVTAEYWWVFPHRDCGYDDVPGNCTGRPLSACEKLCDETTGCAGFNSHGMRSVPTSYGRSIDRTVPRVVKES